MIAFSYRVECVSRLDRSHRIVEGSQGRNKTLRKILRSLLAPAFEEIHRKRDFKLLILPFAAHVKLPRRQIKS